MKIKILVAMVAFAVIFGMAGEAMSGSIFVIDSRSEALGGQRIVMLDSSPGPAVELNSWSAPGVISISGLAFDSEKMLLYYASGAGEFANKVYELSLLTGISTELSFTLPEGVNARIDGLAFVNGSLFLNDSYGNKIYEINPATGATIRTPDSIGTYGALGGAAGRVFAATDNGMTIVELDVTTDPVTQLNAFPSPDGMPVSGLAFDGVNLYAGTVWPGNIYILMPDPQPGDDPVLGIIESLGFIPAGLAAMTDVGSGGGAATEPDDVGLSVRRAKVRFNRHEAGKGKIHVAADFGEDVPVPGLSEDIYMFFNGIELFNRPFSAFSEHKPNVFKLKEGDLKVYLNFKKNRIRVKLKGVELNGDVTPETVSTTVELGIGTYTGSETIDMRLGKKGRRLWYKRGCRH